MNPSRDKTASILRGAPALPLPARIRVVGGTATPDILRLTTGTCVVGAGSGSDILIKDPTVSRRHVELTLVPEGIHVADLGSRNGTFYLGQRVERITLALGSRLRVGPAELLFEIDRDALDETLGAGPSEYMGLCG